MMYTIYNMSIFSALNMPNNNIYMFNSFMNNLLHNTCHDKFMYLKIFVDNSDTNANTDNLKTLYINAANSHNQKIMDDPHFFDAGFDLFLPSSTTFTPNQVNKVDFKVKCCAKIYHLNLASEPSSKKYFTGFYTHPRSSLSKTPLRLANSTGIIDAGYRGNLIGMFDCNTNTNTNNDLYRSEIHSRLLQICAPSLMPIYVEIVDSLEDLGPSTSRGAGGIGSTGI